MTPGVTACRGLAGTIWLVALLCIPGSAWAQSVESRPLPDAIRLPSVIPIFPLRDVTLFPHVSRPLFIFEPRYRAMVADALTGDRIIGMVLLRPGYEKDYEGRPPVYAVGCAGRITKYEQLPDGRYIIELRGFSKFRVTSEDQSRPYRLASVEAIEDVSDTDGRVDVSALRLSLESLLTTFLPLEQELLLLPDEEFVNLIAQSLELEPVDRQELLELNGPAARAQALIDRLETRVTPLR